ncbi:peptide chain release factor N(5)-glutamine methyltransferase [Metallibacterium sp.]|jgi:release factor glutamine methyltransferase|uniref:peptide chain release factor N(5)-glutamine methyltransferase n=1 Tax=Metallibacterium sp. TaxID=2940281 RepID=UPI002617E830|nr:peptide chain release factor N(5)-glutamine methyltransferase [Metallibacterium sp.]
MPHMTDLRTLLTTARVQLASDEAALEAELLLAVALGHPRSWLYAHADAVPEPAAITRFETLIARRAAGEPVAYLLGRRWFWTLELEVGPECLIPRPETELLLEQALLRLPQDAPARVADLGTGSGALALALASARPHAHVLATDASAVALTRARANARRLGLARRVRFAEGDWCAALGAERFAMLVSNPPYLADDDAHLQQGDLRFEPRMALAAGVDGLDALRVIIHAAPEHLHARGWLLLEHGAEQGLAVRALLAARGFVEVRSLRDLQAHERVTLGQWQNAAP